MGLMDRLKAAQAAREEGDEVIDLTDDAEETAAPEPKIIWGRPSACPSCGEHGYLDRIDLVRRTMYQHCPVCMHRWENHESETVRLVES